VDRAAIVSADDVMAGDFTEILAESGNFEVVIATSSMSRLHQGHYAYRIEVDPPRGHWFAPGLAPAG
jgi:hypothetical protein